MGADLDATQQLALREAESLQHGVARFERELADAVRRALKAGVPILTLANALGVSRSRIRRLAR